MSSEHQLLRHPAAQADSDALLQLPLGQIGPVLPGQRDGHAARLSPGHDGDLVHGVLAVQLVDHHGVARLVIGGKLALVHGASPPGCCFSGPAMTLIIGLLEVLAW